MSEPSRAYFLWSRRWTWVGLTLATVVLLSAARWCGLEYRAHYRFAMTTGQTGSTIVYVQNGTITTWDWKTNVRREIPSASALGQQGVVARDGSKVAVVANSQQSMLICDLQSHETRTVTLPHLQQSYLGTPIGFVGDGRYVVFWTLYDTGGPVPGNVARLRIVDAETGSLTDEYTSPSDTGFELSDADETFESLTFDYTKWADGSKVKMAEWRVTEEGKLIPLGDETIGRLPAGYCILKDDGRLRLLNEGDNPSAFPQAKLFFSQRLYETGRSAKWLIHPVDARGRRIGPRALMDEATGRLTPLESVVIFDELDNGQSVSLTSKGIPRENALLLVDRYGDVQVFEASTGKTIGLDAPARMQRTRFLGIAACLALMAALWLVAADRTPSLNWFGIGLTISAMLTQASVISSAFAVPTQTFYDARLHPWQVMVTMVAAGSAASCLVAIAWYWAWGDGLQPVRWCKGVAAWFVILMPANFVISRWYETFPPSLEIVKTAGFSLVAITYGVIGAGALALVLASPRLLGFRYGPQSDAPAEPTRYQVGDLVVTMCGIAIVLGMVQFRVLELGVPGNQWVFFGSPSSITAVVTAFSLVAASLLTTALIARWSWLGAMAATILVAGWIGAVVVTHSFDILQVGSWTLGDDTPYWGNAAFLVAAWVTSAVPIWMLHRKGWRWARCVQTQLIGSELTAPV